MFGKKKERPVPREDGLTDYDVYIMGKQERILTIILLRLCCLQLDMFLS